MALYHDGCIRDSRVVTGWSRCLSAANNTFNSLILDLAKPTAFEWLDHF